MKHLLVVILFFTAACERQTMPAITSRKADPPKKITSPYAPEGTVAADTVQGKQVFSNQCNRCHGLPDIKAYSEERWENILLRMLPRAGVDKVNAVHVRAYILRQVASP